MATKIVYSNSCIPQEGISLADSSIEYRLDSEEDPNDYQFFLKWKNKLDIGNADVQIIKNKDSKYKELLVSYKSIYMNTYTLYILDISTDN